MNKYLLEVEAIQFTGDNGKEIEEKFNEIWRGVADVLRACGIEKGKYIIYIPKRGNFGGDPLLILSEEEFEVYARRLY